MSQQNPQQDDLPPPSYNQLAFGPGEADKTVYQHQPLVGAASNVQPVMVSRMPDSHSGEGSNSRGESNAYSCLVACIIFVIIAIVAIVTVSTS